MKTIILAAAALAIGAISAPAFADTVTTTGTIPAVCKVTASNPAFDITVRTQQRIADLLVQCNSNKANPVLAVAATNGVLKNGTYTVPYTAGVDLNGPINAGQYSWNGTSVTQNLVLTGGQELAQGVTGDMTMVVATAPYIAGTYTEVFNLTIG